MDWIHCNKCSKRYQSGAKFFLTNCLHMKCETCVAKTSQPGQPRTICLVCGRECAITPLNKDLSPDLQPFFMPYQKVIEKHDIIQSFQIENMLSLLKSISTKYNCAKIEIRKLHSELSQVKNGLEDFKKRYEQMRQSLRVPVPPSPSTTSSRAHLPSSTQIPGTYSPSILSHISSVSKVPGPAIRQRNLLNTPGAAQRQVNARYGTQSLGQPLSTQRIITTPIPGHARRISNIVQHQKQSSGPQQYTPRINVPLSTPSPMQAVPASRASTSGYQSGGSSRLNLQKMGRPGTSSRH